MKKLALVTGANRGLGLETSKKLASKGFRVLMGCRDLGKVAEIEDQLKNEGLDVEFFKLDVDKISDIRDIHDYIRESEDKLDLLINNAGVFLDSYSDSILDSDPVIILKTIETNTMGPMQLMQSLVPLMSEGSQIINISSGMGSLQDMESGAIGYRMSKAALNVLTLISSKDLAAKNISVNSICPGWCRTDMGGRNATRSSEEGIESIIWLAEQKNPPTGKFFRDKAEIEW